MAAIHPYHTDNRQFEEATTELSQLESQGESAKLQQKEEKDLSGERKQNDGEGQTLQKQQEKLSGEIATSTKRIEGAHRPVSKDSEGRGRTEIRSCLSMKTRRKMRAAKRAPL